MRFLLSTLILGCALLLSPAKPAHAASCKGFAALLAADGGVWKAVNENPRNGNTYERVFKFVAADGKIQGDVIRQLRDERITAVDVAEDAVTIKFSDGRGDHRQRYSCGDDPRVLKGSAEGPRPGGTYEHGATLTKQ